MSDPAPAPAPAPAPQPDWFQRQEHAIAQAVHNTVVYLDPLRVEIEHQIATVAHETWQNAAKWTADYFARNRDELAKKAAERILAIIVAKIPGADAFAPEISTAIVTEAADMFGVLIAELQKEGHVIAPQPPAPTPAPEPAK